MNPIYDFEAHRPPVLTEAMVEEALERKRLQRQTLLLTLAAALTQVCLVLLGVLLYPDQPAVSFLCLGYVCLSVTGGGAVALVYTRKRRLVP